MNYLCADPFLEYQPCPRYLFRRDTESPTKVIKVMVWDHLTKTFVLFEKSVDLAFVCVLIDPIVTVVLFHAMDESQEDVDLFFVLDLALLCGGEVYFVHFEGFLFELMWEMKIL